MSIRNSLIGAFFSFMFFVIAAEAAGSDNLVWQVNSGGHVLMIRHAYAPGTGDPDNFRIGECATQRNLNDQGRAQGRKKLAGGFAPAASILHGSFPASGAAVLKRQSS